MKLGKVYLIPSHLADTLENRVFPSFNNEVITALRVFVCEQVKHTRRFIRSLEIRTPFEEVTFLEMGKHTDIIHETEQYKAILKQGFDIGIISEAGCPAIADPGHQFVLIAHQMGADVIPLVGPSSILLALIGSGLNGQSFTFHGYLPIDKGAKQSRFKNMQRDAAMGITQIFMETPFRNNTLLEELIKQCDKGMYLCIASELTGKQQKIKTKTIADWSKSELPNLHKIPAVFVLGKA